MRIVSLLPSATEALFALGLGRVITMAATGSANPIGVGQRVAQIVEGCMAPARTKECFSDKVNHPENGELQQQVQQSRAANPQGRPSSSPDKLQDHGQGNGGGSVSAPGQGRAGARQW